MDLKDLRYVRKNQVVKNTKFNMVKIRVNEQRIEILDATTLIDNN